MNIQYPDEGILLIVN